MTPEEANPRTLWDYENKFGDERGDETMFAVQAFTAKGTVEIAKAYAQACLVCENTCHLGCNHLSNCRNYWREHFKELIK